MNLIFYMQILYPRLMYQLPNNTIRKISGKNLFFFDSEWSHKQWNSCLKRKVYIIRNDTNIIRQEILKYRRERYRTIQMYVIIGKQKYIQCDELKNLLDENVLQ